MKVQVNSEEVLKQFNEELLVIERKLTHMAIGFGQTIAAKAEGMNPLGNEVDLESFYLMRSKEAPYYLKPQHGFSKGSWQGSLSWPLPFRETYDSGAGLRAVNAVPSQLAPYKLGDTYYIGNTGPYIGVLETKYSIMPKSVSQITSAYSTDLRALYDKG